MPKKFTRREIAERLNPLLGRDESRLEALESAMPRVFTGKRLFPKKWIPHILAATECTDWTEFHRLYPKVRMPIPGIRMTLPLPENELEVELNIPRTLTIKTSELQRIIDALEVFYRVTGLEAKITKIEVKKP